MPGSQLHYPRLLYVGDVPVDSTVGGSAFIYRLLQRYPTDRLRVIEGSIWRSIPEKRLPGVAYDILSIGTPRLMPTPIGRAYGGFLSFSAKFHSHRLNRIASEFKPDAIISVAHGFLWQTAAELAKRLGLPFHLNINDDWLNMGSFPPVLRPWAKQRFGSVYKMAAGRWCASPYMAEIYEEQFGVKGSVLYPLLAAEQKMSASAKVNDSTRSLAFAYAGSIHNQAYADCLSNLASVLESSGSRLLIYSSLTEDVARNFGLLKPNIELRPLIPPLKLVSTLREAADVICVPMSFNPLDLPNMRAAFPSKFPDCTAVGLPLLVWGPSECSAVRWARENPGFAEIVDENDTMQLGDSVSRLVGNPTYRASLGVGALKTCERFFSHAGVREKFYQAICGNGA